MIIFVYLILSLFFTNLHPVSTEITKDTEKERKCDLVVETEKSIFHMSVKLKILIFFPSIVCSNEFIFGKKIVQTVIRHRKNMEWLRKTQVVSQGRLVLCTKSYNLGQIIKC